jgi:hypothetical protein
MQQVSQQHYSTVTHSYLINGWNRRPLSYVYDLDIQVEAGKTMTAVYSE